MVSPRAQVSPAATSKNNLSVASAARACRWAVFFLGVLVLVVTFTPLVPWWAHHFAGTFDTAHGKVLIVLGAAPDGADGILSYSSYLRAAYAVRAYREGWVREIVFSGVAEPMADFAVSQGVPREIIRIDDSVSTHESAINVPRLLAGVSGDKVLLTSDYHMYRARRAFERAGMKVIPRAFPDAFKQSTGWQGRWGAFLELTVESVKIVCYRAHGWI